MYRTVTALFAAVLALSALATPAAAGTSYLAYNPSDRITTALTRGVTLEVHRGLFGASGHSPDHLDHHSRLGRYPAWRPRSGPARPA
jgi:hypothetical protein